MFTLNCKGRLLVVEKPIVMGIINVTPDSFYAGSRKESIEAVIRQAGKMLEEGAAVLDIGGQSTRPGSEQIGGEAEAERIIPVLTELSSKFPDAILSVDTYHSSVAEKAVKAGASIVNDISGGQLDPAMIETVGKLNVPYVCMHTKGNPEYMQQLASYEDVTLEVLDYFIQKKEECRKAGINDVIIDPGFGFAKTIAHNFELLKKLTVLKILDRPILVGLSRKSTVYKTLGTTPEEALNGTTVLNTIALLNGANILRVHDVKEAMETIKLVEAYAASL